MAGLYMWEPVRLSSAAKRLGSSGLIKDYFLRSR